MPRSLPGRVREPRPGLLLRGILLLVVCAAPSGGCGARRAGGAPSVELDRVPMAGQGGTETLDEMEGRAVGARAGQRIVLYARSGAWYVQPYVDRPFTSIRPDSTWKNSTHLGTEYAALLVEEGYSPPARIDELPRAGGGVVAAAVAAGDVVFWRKSWFRASAVLALALALLALYRHRVRRLTRQLNLRFEERLAERTRVAQEIHDTFLQDVLSVSMQLHVVADGLPGDSPARAPLGHIQRLMGRVIEEGRNTLRGLRAGGDQPPELAEAFSRMPLDLGLPKRVAFRVRVEGRRRPLHPVVGDELYRVGREALARAFGPPKAGVVEVTLEYGRRQLRLKLRSSDPSTPRPGPGVLDELRGRAERIGGRLKARGRGTAGAELELSLPADVAFRPEHPANTGRRFFVPRARRPAEEVSSSEGERAE
ncbi:MAG TPA: histidine kinase [Pyrinomonadaceae bacterium]|nr:histidine kinase [Pyrinomonadaceae bacterium]